MQMDRLHLTMEENQWCPKKDLCLYCSGQIHLDVFSGNNQRWSVSSWGLASDISILTIPFMVCTCHRNLQYNRYDLMIPSTEQWPNRACRILNGFCDAWPPITHVPEVSSWRRLSMLTPSVLDWPLPIHVLPGLSNSSVLFSRYQSCYSLGP